MRDYAEDVAIYLESQGLGTIGTDIFIREAPDDPDNCLVVSEYAGKKPGKFDESDYPGIQVLSRATTQEVARGRLSSVNEKLHGLEDTWINGHFYLGILAKGGITPLDKDKAERWRFVQSYDADVSRL